MHSRLQPDGRHYPHKDTPKHMEPPTHTYARARAHAHCWGTEGSLPPVLITPRRAAGGGDGAQPSHSQGGQDTARAGPRRATLSDTQTLSEPVMGVGSEKKPPLSECPGSLRSRVHAVTLKQTQRTSHTRGEREGGTETVSHSQDVRDPHARGPTQSYLRGHSEPATPSEWGPRQSPTLRVTRTPRGASRANPRGVAAGAVPPRCHPEAKTMPGARTRDGPVSPPLRPRPTGAQGGGRQLGQRPRGAPLGPATPGGDPSPAQDPCRLSPPPGLGPPPDPRPLSGPEPHPAPGPLPPEDPPPGWDPCRLGPRPAPGPPPGRGTLSQPRNPCPPGTPARPGPAARRLTSGRLPGSAHSLPEVHWPSETEPSSPQSRSRRNNGAPGRGRLAAVSARLALRLGLRLPLCAEQLPARGCNWAGATRRRTRPARAPPPRPRRRPALGARPPTNGEGAARRGRGLEKQREVGRGRSRAGLLGPAGAGPRATGSAYQPGPNRGGPA